LQRVKRACRGRESDIRVRQSALEAMIVIIEAVRKIIEAVRLFVEAVRVLVEAVRVLRSSANKSIPIDPILRNNFLRSRFDPVKFRAIVRFASISRSFGLT
jgi:hypothetical protein